MEGFWHLAQGIIYHDPTQYETGGPAAMERLNHFQVFLKGVSAIFSIKSPVLS
jgi:hypothetical protein